MILPASSIRALRDRPEGDILGLASALQHVLDALFQLEKDETDPDMLKALSASSIRVCDDLKEVLQVLEDKIDD
jgi:hypothetical protein